MAKPWVSMSPQNRAVHQPTCSRQCIPAIASAKDHDGAGHCRKRREVGLILGDEHPRHRDVEPGEAFGVERHVGQRRAGQHLDQFVEHAEADAERLVKEAVTTAELTDTGSLGGDGLRGQREVEQLLKNAAMRLDEPNFAAAKRDLTLLKLPAVDALRINLLTFSRNPCRQLGQAPLRRAV
jgi:hypothetical protein